MKHFYFKDTMLRKNKMYGYQVREVSVYKLNKDKTPSLIGRQEYQTGSTRGAQWVAFQLLVDNKYIPNKYKGKCYFDSGAYTKYGVHELI